MFIETKFILDFFRRFKEFSKIDLSAKLLSSLLIKLAEHWTLNIEHWTFEHLNIDHAALNNDHSTFNIQNSKFNIQHSTFNIND